MEFNLQKISDAIDKPNASAREEARRRLDCLTKPQGSLGRLEEIVVKLAGIQGSPIPQVEHKAIITFAGDHGVTEEGVSTVPSVVTALMVDNFQKEGAAINALCQTFKARHKVVDVGVKHPYQLKENCEDRNLKKGTENFTKTSAMTVEEATCSLKAGWDSFWTEKERGLDLYGTGEMGIGNTTAAAAVMCALTGLPAQMLVGPGTGLDAEGIARKIEAVEKAIEKHRPNPTDPIDLLAKVGGLEIGAITGSLLAAAASKTAAVIDGYISTAGALLAIAIDPMVQDYLFFSHQSAEPGHEIILKGIAEKAYLNLDLRLGEGTGAALFFPIAEGACSFQKNMATMADLGL